MRKLLSKIFIFIGVLSLVLGILNAGAYNIAYAEDLELKGTNNGLEITPDSKNLFNLKNLNPGDSKDGKITIKNNYSEPFNLYMRAERTSKKPEGKDLFNQLELTIFLRGDQVYSGPMNNFGISNIFIGKFSPNDVEEMKATVRLPGPSTGNEFQGKAVDVNWIFTATLTDTPETPDTPDTPDTPGRPGTGTDPGRRPRPSVPEEIEIKLDEIPLGKKEIPDEEILEEITLDEIPLGEPEETEEKVPEENEIKKDKVPLDKIDEPKERFSLSRGFLPRTGELSPMMFYGAGILLVLIGTTLGFKKKK